MKKIFQYLFTGAVAVSLISSCKKDEQKVYFEGSTPPVLTASSTATVVLDSTNAANRTGITFTWTNPDYKFTTGVSSQDVTYVLQIDTTGSNFTNPSLQEVSISKDLEFKPSTKEFNAFFNKMGLKYDLPHDIEFRLKAALAGGVAVPVYSNVVKIKITPYLDVAVPIPFDGTLWGIGNAFAAGWTNPMSPSDNAVQKFTRVSETLYVLTTNFVGGGNFKLIQRQGDWDLQYRPKYANGADVPFATGNFERKNADPGWNGPASAGAYKITVNFITGTYKIEKL